MNRYDMHVHSWARTKFMEKPDPKVLLSNMAKAGIYGGCVLSNPPKEESATGTDFETRMEELRLWTQGHTDRLFPILFVHPGEDAILEKVEQAVERGVMGFKIMCNDFYVYEDHSMALLSKIAELGKPVAFHTGILFDNKIASIYNRPLHWEHLLQIPKLKFSMGHCGWPWTDECFALYGEFKYAPMLPKQDAPEMFLDLTPGPQEPYRKDLFTKIFGMNWGIGDSIMFGTDCSADHYNPDYAAKWLTLDTDALDGLGIDDAARDKIYRTTLSRFLGVELA